MLNIVPPMVILFPGLGTPAEISPVASIDTLVTPSNTVEFIVICPSSATLAVKVVLNIKVAY